MKNTKWTGKYLCPGCFIPSGGLHKKNCKFAKLSKDKQDIMELQAMVKILEQNLEHQMQAFNNLVEHYKYHWHNFEVPVVYSRFWPF